MVVVNLGLPYGSLGPKPKQMTLDEKNLYMDYTWMIVVNVVWALGVFFSGLLQRGEVPMGFKIILSH
jgi:hypothetical protein